MTDISFCVFTSVFKSKRSSLDNLNNLFVYTLSEHLNFPFQFATELELVFVKFQIEAIVTITL